MKTPIVAGADGSEESLAATAWAAVAAARRHVPLCIVHVVDQDPGLPAHAHASRFRHDLSHHARSILAKASGHADLVVTVGERVRPGLARGPDSVADALVHHAQCPVAVIPSSSLRPGVEADRSAMIPA